jgi:Carboxypeptidase regulatory-like domain
MVPFRRYKLGPFMRLGSSLLFALVSFSKFLPASAGAQSLAASSERFELRGRVVNSITGEPVPNALVEVPGSRLDFSDADGKFTFAGLPAGQLVVTARKPGFLNRGELGNLLGGADASVQIPSDRPVTVKLTPEGILFGEVKTPEGDPAQGVTVLVQRWTVAEGHRQLQSFKSASTDDQGSFRIAELPPGRYLLLFAPTDQGITRQRITRKPKREATGFGRQFYPGVPDASEATVFELRGGAHQHVVQKLARQRLFQISGVLHGIGAEPAGVNVTLQSSSQDFAQESASVNPKTGEFRIFGVPPGNYLLTAMAFPKPTVASSDSDGSAPGQQPQRPLQPLMAALPLNVTTDLADVSLSFGSGVSLDVLLKDEASDRNAVRQISVQLIQKDFQGQRRYVTVPPPPGAARADTRFEELSPGVYTVEAVAPLGYVAELRCGSADLLRDDLVLAPGAAPPPIEVTLRDDSALLTVTLKAKDSTAAIVVYSTEFPKRSFLLMYFPGTTSIAPAPLPPGTYDVLAVSDPGDLEYRNPRAMEKYLSHATSITLQPREKKEISLDVVDVQEPAP